MGLISVEPVNPAHYSALLEINSVQAASCLLKSQKASAHFTQIQEVKWKWHVLLFQFWVSCCCSGVNTGLSRTVSLKAHQTHLKAF